MPEPPRRRPPHIQLAVLEPVVDGGRYRPKRCAGDVVEVAASIFRDGHVVLRSALRWKGPSDKNWSEAPMAHVDDEVAGVRWEGAFAVDRPGRWTWSVV